MKKPNLSAREDGLVVISSFNRCRFNEFEVTIYWQSLHYNLNYFPRKVPLKMLFLAEIKLWLMSILSLYVLAKAVLRPQIFSSCSSCGPRLIPKPSKIYSAAICVVTYRETKRFIPWLIVFGDSFIFSTALCLSFYSYYRNIGRDQKCPQGMNLRLSQHSCGYEKRKYLTKPIFYQHHYFKSNKTEEIKNVSKSGDQPRTQSRH